MSQDPHGQNQPSAHDNNPTPELFSQPITISTPQPIIIIPSTDIDLTDVHLTVESLDLNPAHVHLGTESKLTPEQEEDFNLIDEIVQEELSSSPPQAQPMPPLYELLVFFKNIFLKLVKISC